MHILVTGASGYLGCCLVEQLQNGHKVICANRNDFDYRDEQSIRDFLSNYEVDAVVHLASTIVADSVEAYYDINVTGVYTLLKACIQKEIQHFIFASANSVYAKNTSAPHKETELLEPEDMDLYPRTKYLAESIIRDICRGHGIRYTNLRIGDIYGSGQRHGNFMKALVGQAAEGRCIRMIGTGKRTRDYIHVTDVVRGILFALEKQLSGTYNLGTGKGYSVKDLVEIAAAHAGSNCEIVTEKAVVTDESVIVLCMEKMETEGFKIVNSLEYYLQEMIKKEIENGKH